MSLPIEIVFMIINLLCFEDVKSLCSAVSLFKSYNFIWIKLFKKKIGLHVDSVISIVYLNDIYENFHQNASTSTMSDLIDELCRNLTFQYQKLTYYQKYHMFYSYMSSSRIFPCNVNCERCKWFYFSKYVSHSIWNEKTSLFKNNKIICEKLCPVWCVEGDKPQWL